MIVSTRSAATLADPVLRSGLLANIEYLRAGAIGPDLFYAPNVRLHHYRGHYSDLAHYCHTNTLALAMIAGAGSDLRLKAFAYGWLSHNVQDSVAHPWVNGFVGGPFRFGLNALEHGKLEAWVNAHIQAEIPPEAGEEGGYDAIFINSILPYFDPAVQDLMVRAFESVYATGRDCKGRPNFKSLTREAIRNAAQATQDYVMLTNGGLANELPVGIDAAAVQRTYRTYLGLSLSYTKAGWGDPGALPDFNLDQGIDAGRAALEDAYPGTAAGAGRVFPTPGDAYVAGGAKPAGYEDKCSGETNREKCAIGVDPPPPDMPDDNVAVGSAAALPDSELRNAATAFSRLATKRGQAWPWLARLQEHRNDEVLRQLGVGDRAGFEAALEAARVAYNAARSRDPQFEAMFSAERPDPGFLVGLSDVLVLQNGFWDAASHAVERGEEPAEIVAPSGLGRNRPGGSILVAASGGLYGLETNKQFSNTLDSFVASGGTLIVFSQQHGSDFSVLPTRVDGSIHGWGWLEDNSCYTNGAYIETFHPILASQSKSLVTSNIDGYFDSIPDDSIVLLRRVKNGLPAMFMYPYGQGWVIVSSSYDDWGGFNQTGPGARAIIRDAIAWAKKPADLPINLPGSTVSVSLQVKNITDLPAGQVKLVLMSPSRDRVVAEQTVAQAIAAGEAADVPFSHAFPEAAELGIYHVDYELLDETGVTLQPMAEEDSGRIVVAKPPTPGQYRASDLGVSIVMPGGEEVLEGQTAVFRYRLQNHSSSPKHLRAYFDLNHSPATLAEDLVLAGGAIFEEEITVTAAGPWPQRFWVHVFEEGGTPRVGFLGIVSVPGETFGYQASDGKGFRVLRPAAKQLEVTLDRPAYGRGETATITVNVPNALSLPWSGSMRLIDAAGVALQEQPVSVPGGGAATLSFSVPIPSGTKAFQVYYLLELRAAHTAQGSWVLLPIQEPHLRALGPPVWSGAASGGSVAWELENVRAVPLGAGTVKIKLTSGSSTLHEESQPLVLGPSPTGRGSVVFALPMIPWDFGGVVSLEAGNGHGQVIRAQLPVTRRLVSSVRPTAPDYAVGDAAEVELTLVNTGNTREDGEAGGEIPGIAALAPQAYSLAPGARTTLRYGFAIPADAAGGLHQGSLELSEGGALPFTVVVRRPELVFSFEDRVYGAGETISVVLRNAGGSTATPEIRAQFRGLAPVTASASLAVGEETTLEVPVPAQTPSGEYELLLTADDEVHVARASRFASVRIAGTQATLSVATDADLYLVGSAIDASAVVTNGGVALAAAGLHLEIATPCAPFQEGVTFHFETWDGTGWVERAFRGRGPLFETDQLDLAPYWPDPDGEYKLRIRHDGEPPAAIDFVGLISGGAVVAPTEAVLESGGDVLTAVLASDESGVDVTYTAMVVRFPATAAPSLLYRAREGQPSCTPTVLWQRDVPLEMAGGATRFVSDRLSAGAMLGQHVLTGTLKNRDGDVLAQASKPFEIIAGTLAVSTRTDASLYRTGAVVHVTGTLRNLGSLDESNVLFGIRVHGRYCDTTIHYETIDLAAGEARDYSLSLVPVDVCPYETDLAVVASLFSLAGSVESERPFKTGEPAIDVRFEVPDPAVRFVRSTPRLVAAQEADLDAVSHSETTPLEGTLPFPVVLDGVRHTGFRQSLHGFVELVPEGAPGPTGSGGGCLEGSDPATVLAGLLFELDPGASGFVGYKRYVAGSMDRVGRIFEKDTLVFFWEAPARYVGGDNRFQVLLSEDGLVRIDVGLVSPALGTSPVGCSRTGLSMPPGSVTVFEGSVPFGVRVEGVGREAFQGSVTVRNDGSFPGAVSLEYGRESGPRSTEALILAPRETRTIRFTDAVVAPTTYTLVATGDASVSLQETVTPSDGLFVRYTGPSDVAPGTATLPVRLTKTGGVGGRATVTYTFDSPSGVQTLVRTYDLEPGVATDDSVAFALVEGAATLSVTADVALEASSVLLRVGPQERISFVAAAGGVEGGVLRIGADIANTGLQDFSGEIQVEGPGGQFTPVAVPAGHTAHFDVSVDLAAATAGANSYVVRLVSEAGVVLSETTFTREVLGPRVVLVESPAGALLEAGGVATLRFRLRNDGDQRALGSFSFQVFDEPRDAPFDLAPEQDVEVVFDVRIADDVEEKRYPARYVIAVQGLADVPGQVNFSVNGIALDVEPSLDKDAYLDGETARLTVAVTNGRPGLGTDYLVRVHYGGFEETRPLVVTGSAATLFEIPLPQVTGEPVFIGISHPDGRSLYINTLHVRRADALASVTLDRQVYVPGSSVTIAASAASTGTLALDAPGYSESVEVTGSVTRSFSLPADLPGGTQFVSWSFTGTAGSASGSVPFDVAGLRVRVFEARLDKGRYETGESIETRLQVNTTAAASVTLRAFVLDPEGLSQLVGETTLSLDPDTDLLATNSWPFESAIAGLHRLVYGIYLPGGDTFLASGSLAFDVGNAAVLGVRTDRADYPAPDITVEARVSAFVSGPATLRLEVDGQVVRSQSVSTPGIVELPLALDGVAPGPHELVAVMDGGGYVSEASTTFSMGSSLPDLVPGLPSARPLSGAAWKIDVTVQNAGRAQAGASELVARDVSSSAVLGTMSVTALAPGAMALVSIDWNVLGAAGGREIEVVADAGASVREYREDNNASRGTLEVPALLFEALAAPAYEANVEADLHASVTNLTADESFASLSVVASVRRPDGEVVALAPAAVASVAPGSTASVSTPWAVGRSVPGTYVFEGRLFDGTGATLGSSARAFSVVQTHAFTGTVAANPSPGLPGEPLVFEGHITNAGNVAASGTAIFELVATDHTVAARRETPADVPTEGSADVSASLDPLDAQPGDYQLVLEMEVEGRSHPVASSPLTVAGAGTEARIESDLTPRVLVYLGGGVGDLAGRARRAAFVQASLTGTGAVVGMTGNPLEFARLVRSGLWNTYVYMTDAPILVPLLGDELREAVFRGDGLVYVPWKAAGAAREIEPALGVKVEGQLPGEVHTLRLLDGPLGPAQTLTLRSPATRMKLEGATLAGTISSKAVLGAHSFGHGRGVTMGFDPAVAPGDPARAPLQGLFARAVLYAAPREARVFAAGTVIPLVVSLDNPGSSAQAVEVSLALPAGVRIASVEDAPVASDPPAWQVTLPAGGRRTLHLQVVLPDQAGSYSVESTIKVSGQAIGEPPTFLLEVSRSTQQALADVIAELENLDAPPGDRGHVQAAISHLRHAQALGNGPAGLEARIRFAADASAKLGQVGAVHLSGPRSEIARLIAAWERAAYEPAPSG